MKYYAEAETVMIHNKCGGGDNNGTGYEVLLQLEECNRNGTQKNIPMEENILKIMRAIEIRKELKERNFLVTGNKAELLSRLRKGLSDKVPVGAKKADRTEKKASNSLAAAFLSTVFWKPLVALEDIVVE